MTDNQPRYTTKRLHDEITKARAYGVEQAATLVDGFRCNTGEYLPRKDLVDGIRALASTPAPTHNVVGSDDWFNQVVSFFVKHDMLDAREEYDINDLMVALADNYEPKADPQLMTRALAYLEGSDPQSTSGGERNSDLRQSIHAALGASK